MNLVTLIKFKLKKDDILVLVLNGFFLSPSHLLHMCLITLDYHPPPATSLHPRAYLCHEAVGSCALLVLEDDVRVVVGDEILEPGVATCNLALTEPAGGQRVLRHVGHVLLEHERGELLGPATSARAPTRATRRHYQR